jgi:hypothetical protein
MCKPSQGHKSTGVTTKRVDLSYNADSQMATITRYTDMNATQPVAIYGSS